MHHKNLYLSLIVFYLQWPKQLFIALNMPSGEENTNHDVLYSAPHPLRPHRIDSSVLLLDDSLTVRCKDRRSGKVWGQRVSVAVVSALAQNYYYNLRMLWDLLCRSMVFTGGGVHFSTQHIIHFPLCRSSHGVDSYRIYEVRST